MALLVMAWSNPGGVDFVAFTGYAQLFGRIILSCRRDKLREWSEDTLKEMMKWGGFLEELREAMSGSDVVQAQRYLENPSSFVSTGQENEMTVVQAGLTCRILAASGHYILRNLLKNQFLSSNLVLFKAMILQWLSMIDEPSDRPEAASVFVRDLGKELIPCQLRSKFTLEWLQRHVSFLWDEVDLSPNCIFDLELRFFVMKPANARLFGLSRALIPKLNSLEACEKSVQLCKKSPKLLEVLLLAMVPGPLCFRAKQISPLSSRMCDMLVSVLLKSDLQLTEIDNFLLIHVAAKSQLFASHFRSSGMLD